MVVKNLLKEKNCKVTPARLAILEVFSENKLPLDAKMVYKKTKKNKDLDEVTVYRTLSVFESRGILKRVDMRKDSVYFELAKDHHHHIVCTQCETVEDFKNGELEKVLAKIKSSKFSSKFKSIKEHSLELFGLCKACA